MVIFTVIGILALIAAAIMTVISSMASKKMEALVPKKTTRAIVACIGVVLILLGATIQIIPTGYTGVRATFGQISEKPVPNGFTLQIPFAQTITKINNKQQSVAINAEIWGETKEKTPVYASDTVISYKIAPSKSAWIVVNIANIDNLIDAPTVSSAIKASMVELSVEEVTIRTKIEPLVKEKLTASFNEKYGEGTIEIVKVVINNMDFEQAYNDAIAQKSIAKQIQEKQAIENQTNIEKAEADKKVAIAAAEAKAEAKRIEAEAEAEANRKISASLTDDIIDNKAVDKWDGKLPIVSGGNSIVDIGDVFGDDGGN